MGRRAKHPIQMVAPVSSKKQLLNVAAVCAFMGGMSDQSLQRIRDDKDKRFPKPIQMRGQMPMWSVEQLERWVNRMEKEVEALNT